VEGENTRRRQLAWLNGLRAGLALMLALAAASQWREPGLPAGVLAAVAGAALILSLLWRVGRRLATRQPAVVGVMLAADAVLVAVLVAQTGGLHSDFSIVYVLPILAAGVLGGRHLGLLVGGLSAALLAGTVLLQYAGALTTGPGVVVMAVSGLPPATVAGANVALNALGFVSVGVLTGYLGDRVQRADEHLERASSQMADLRALSEHVIDSLTGGLATADLGGRVLTLNRAGERILALPAAYACGRAAREVLQLPAEHDITRAAPRPAGGPQRVEFPFTRTDGSHVDLGLTVAPLVTAAGQSGWIFTFQDLTAAKQQEREAQRQRHLAAVGEMAAGIAHEIRNPLASMSGSIQILRQELKLDEEQAALMDIVLRESERLNASIRNFLAYARPAPVVAARFDLAQVLRDTAALLRNNAELRPAHELVVHPAEGAVWAEADEAQVRQVIWNLATNGIRAMPGGGRLRLAALEEPTATGRAVVIEVDDEGVGFPAEELDTVFQPFRSRFERGTGLGLAIVHRIATEHGGTVTVTARPQRGTRARVVLPQAAAKPAATNARVA
jgi:two-component system sensor histidine kinase PilS (NtrC family)